MDRVESPTCESPLKRFSIDAPNKKDSPLEVNRLKSLLKTKAKLAEFKYDTDVENTTKNNKEKKEIIFKLSGTTVKLCTSCAIANENIKNDLQKPKRERKTVKKDKDDIKNKRVTKEIKDPNNEPKNKSAPADIGKKNATKKEATTKITKPRGRKKLAPSSDNVNQNSNEFTPIQEDNAQSTAIDNQQITNPDAKKTKRSRQKVQQTANDKTKKKSTKNTGKTPKESKPKKNNKNNPDENIESAFEAMNVTDLINSSSLEDTQLRHLNTQDKNYDLNELSQNMYENIDDNDFTLTKNNSDVSKINETDKHNESESIDDFINNSLTNMKDNTMATVFNESSTKKRTEPEDHTVHSLSTTSINFSKADKSKGLSNVEVQGNSEVADFCNKAVKTEPADEHSINNEKEDTIPDKTDKWYLKYKLEEIQSGSADTVSELTKKTKSLKKSPKDVKLNKSPANVTIRKDKYNDKSKNTKKLNRSEHKEQKKAARRLKKDMKVAKAMEEMSKHFANVHIENLNLHVDTKNELMFSSSSSECSSSCSCNKLSDSSDSSYCFCNRCLSNELSSDSTCSDSDSDSSSTTCTTSTSEDECGTRRKSCKKYNLRNRSVYCNRF